ncbi:MAG: hypothetical protein KA053_03710 [Lentimicrobiaceae bacterium]|nr:hypothetical protein [Lentimicrobiaceae bacterium]
MIGQRQILLFALIACLSSHHTIAQFTLSGEFRPRLEYNHGYKSLVGNDQKPGTFITQRTRLNLDYAGSGFRTGLVLQDVRLWGSQPQLVGNEDHAVSVHQAWAEWLFCKGWSVKAGRQELVYDNARIFGNVDWVQQARSHDAVVLKYEKDFKMHLGLAYHESGSLTNNYYFGPDAYKAMQYLWLNRKFNKLSLSFLFLNNGRPVNIKDTANQVIDQEIEYSQTTGLHAVYQHDAMTFTGYAYFQGGKNGTGKEVSATNLSLELAYRLSENYLFTMGVEQLSGISQLDPGDKITAFNPLYGTNHAFNGWMDYFYVGNHLNSVGLVNPYMKFDYKRDAYTFGLYAHYLMAAADIADPVKPNTAMERTLGTEIDLSLGYTLNPQASIRLGYSQMFGTPSLEVLKGGDHAEVNNWAWCMLIFKPVFLKNQ